MRGSRREERERNEEEGEEEEEEDEGEEDEERCRAREGAKAHSLAPRFIFVSGRGPPRARSALYARAKDRERGWRQETHPSSLFD